MRLLQEWFPGRTPIERNPAIELVEILPHLCNELQW